MGGRDCGSFRTRNCLPYAQSDSRDDPVSHFNVLFVLGGEEAESVARGENRGLERVGSFVIMHHIY